MLMNFSGSIIPAQTKKMGFVASVQLLQNVLTFIVFTVPAVYILISVIVLLIDKHINIFM